MSLARFLLEYIWYVSDTMLVERKKAPNGIELVNPYRVGKHSPTDLVELAREIQLVSI